ncbi:pyrroline-5-carboxylate reductase [Brevibacterium sp.]|jgi:pyrroline-5-carboxylate reductase|uniref:pyrroline-5-carboxylate reductase n=1 Tax=Brevibacterium sp. TaxID=1701 RepID=UPI0025C26FE9|nr:pyrroline-5-carboxylate reductase [Brevibacterium sp.]
MSIAFIGTGNMGGALLRGILAGGQEPGGVTATTRGAASAEELAAELGIRALSLEADPTANRTAVTGADLVFLGVKPWMLADTLTEVRDALAPGAVLVSMAAGVDAATIRRAAPGHPVVRIMPNTPCAVGAGVISLAPDAQVPADVVEELTALLTPVGLVVPVEEAQLPLLTGISGSGVAYFFQLAEHLVDTAVAQGLDAEVAARTVAATAAGAGRLLADRPEPAALRTAVTSKGGTTAAALDAFAAGGFAQLVENAVQAAEDRSLEMEAENRGTVGN